MPERAGSVVAEPSGRGRGDSLRTTLASRRCGFGRVIRGRDALAALVPGDPTLVSRRRLPGLDLISLSLTEAIGHGRLRSLTDPVDGGHLDESATRWRTLPALSRYQTNGPSLV